MMSQLLLLLSGDVETNPGPAREKKPDPKKIMEDKVNSHDEKIEALEKLVNDQKQMLESMTEKQVELQTALEDSKVEFNKSLEDKKVLDASLGDIKVTVGEYIEKQVDLKQIHSVHLCRKIIKQLDMATRKMGNNVIVFSFFKSNCTVCKKINV